ncbi:MAG: glycosyltransferase family 4 protein [Salibacteraceae bacterium]
MKIAYLSANPLLNLASPSGYGTHMREMIKGLRALGHEVSPLIAGGTAIETLAQPGTGSAPKQLLRQLAPPFLWETAKDWRLKRFDGHMTTWFAEEINRMKPDLVYERGTYLQLAGHRVAQQMKLPHIVELNAPLAEEKAMLGRSSWFAKEAEAAERQLLQGAAKIVVVSSRLVQHFSDKYQLPRDKFIITPNAVDLDKVQSSEASTTELRKQLGLENKVVLGFVGSIFPYHGVDLLIRAFDALQTGHPELHLMIVGDGETLPELQELATKLNLNHKITFTGNVPHTEVFNHIALFDIAVLAKTKDYMSPIKVFEYGAMGVAIVAPSTTAVRDVIEDGRHGLLIGEEQTLEGRLKELIDNQKLREQIGKSFQEKVLEEHTWQRMAEKVLA